jgi:uncharacterized protein YndB with AHSA1/START domain
VEDFVFKKLFSVVVLLFVVLVVVIAMQPSEFLVTRTATINAAPDQVFGLVNDFHNWEKWSPWAELDPNMELTYEGPEAGEGAVYAWDGNSEVGKGRMVITDSKPHEHIAMDLIFEEPFAGTSQTDFQFKEADEKTEVTWTMSGKNDFIAKAFSLMMDMDEKIGGDFERGFSRMNALAESLPKPQEDEEPEEGATEL